MPTTPEKPIIILEVAEIDHSFEIGDEVIDINAQNHNLNTQAEHWPDVNGRVVDIDGTNIKVEYTSGTKRWKLHTSLKKQTAN